MPAAPDGPGLPGRLPWSGEASWSWRRVAAGCLVGWRVSWVRAWLPGFPWFAPGLAVPPPPGRCGSRSRLSWPGGRARVARYQRCRVVPGCFLVVLPQRGQPVPRPPPGGICRVGDDYRQAGVRGHEVNVVTI